MDKYTNRICILHFQPLEKFPPVMNMIDYLQAQQADEVYIVSRRNNSPDMLKDFAPANRHVHIIRTGWFKDTGPLRLVNYLLFYLQAFWVLLRHAPASVLYYETLSAWPAMWYKKIRKNVKLLAHYHEYNTQHEFYHSMKLMKWQHRMEVSMYATDYNWISHTNEVRLNKFIHDHQLDKDNKSLFRIMPNYPGKHWLRKEAKPMGGNIIKLVYVGSLGYENMYIHELVSFVKKNERRFSLDIYAYNIHKDVNEMLQELNAANIVYHGGCNYAELPAVLENYDIGLVIYKSYSENWINAVSNKVFEYLACGLDVWFSQDMDYTLKYVEESSYPKVVAVDFNRLEQFDYEAAISREGLPFKEPEFFYENVYSAIYDVMKA